MENVLGEQIKKLRVQHGWSQRFLANQTGISRALINALESGKRKDASLTTVRTLSEEFGTTINHLLYGLEPPLRPKSMGMIVREVQERYEAMELIEIPYRGAVPAGYPFPVEQESSEFISVPREALGAASPQNVYALKISGESLKGDEIYSGDTVLVNFRETEIIDGKIYIVRLGNECVARHVFKTNSHLRLASSNGEYKELLATDVEILGKVILSMRVKRF